MSLRLLLLICLAASGCRDSHEVTKVRTARLGPSSGAIPVGNEPRALELSDGRVALTMMGLHGIVVYDFDSARADTLGRTGAGPGEFERSDVVVAMGGSRFGVLDPVLRRATIYERPGSVEGVIPFATDHVADVEQLSMAAGWFGTGLRGSHDSLPVLHRSVDAAASDTIAHIHIAPTHRIELGAISLNFPIEYAPADFWGVLPDGRTWIARGGANRIDWVMADGRRVTGPSIPYTPIRTVDADQHTWQGMPAPPLIDTVKREMAPFKAPFQGALASDDGQIWLWLNQAAGYPSEQYLVVGADGAPILQVEVPLAHRILAVSRRFVYLLGEDSTGDLVVTRHGRPE